MLRCLSCLVLFRERQQVVPYRDSKLTRLFQSFFSGHGTVTMIINVSGCSTTFDETLHALKYGALATQVNGIAI